MAYAVPIRHMRHRHFARLRRSKEFKAFLAAVQATLEGTGAALTFTAAAASAAVKAKGTLTASAIADGDTVTIGSKVYTFQTTLTDADGNVFSSGTLATDLANLAKAIGLSGTAGTDYAASMTAHPDVTATSTATTVVAEAKVAGTAGNAIASTTTATDAAWGAATLAGGAAAVEESDDLTSAAHGLAVGDGPFLLTSTTTLPAGLLTGTLVWIAAATTDTFKLSTKLGGPVAKVTSAGTGTHTMTKADEIQAIFEYVRRHGFEFVADAADVDDL